MSFIVSKIETKLNVDKIIMVEVMLSQWLNTSRWRYAGNMDIMIYGTHSQFFAYLHWRLRKDSPSISNFLTRLHGITFHRAVIFMNIEFHIFSTWALHTGQ